MSYLYFSTQDAHYHMTSSLESKGSCIDNNHSHFILVDDGTVGKYGGEIEWRANLQNCIAAQKIPRSKCVIDVSYCSNVQEAMKRRKVTIAWLLPVFSHFVGKLLVVVTFCVEMLKPLGKVGPSL